MNSRVMELATLALSLHRIHGGICGIQQGRKILAVNWLTTDSQAGINLNFVCLNPERLSNLA